MASLVGIKVHTKPSYENKQIKIPFHPCTYDIHGDHMTLKKLISHTPLIVMHSSNVTYMMGGIKPWRHDWKPTQRSLL